MTRAGVFGDNHAMNVQGKPYRTIWLAAPGCVRIIDQARLPHEFALLDLRTPAAMAAAIRNMNLRGAGLIGCAAAWGIYLAVVAHAAADDFATRLATEAEALLATRPTAKNLEWAVQRMQARLAGCSPAERLAVAQAEAQAITDEDAEFSRRMGQHGLAILRDIAARKGGAPVNVLTHCNAGWLAFVDHGTALAPVYAAVAAGIPVHVWVDETRPRNQGAALTAWELAQHGVPHTLVADNAGGHLMQHGLVDVVFVGADRVTAAGDVANKIGTYLKALAAHDNQVPFYAVLPVSTIDWQIHDGVREIVIEERHADEVRTMTGWMTPPGGWPRCGFAPPKPLPPTTGLMSRPRGCSRASSPNAGWRPPPAKDCANCMPTSSHSAEGYIKFSFTHEPAPPPAHPALAGLLRVRDELRRWGWLGVLPDGIGYGNISARRPGGNTFVISASGTGRHKNALPEHFCAVLTVDIARNFVLCRGPLPARRNP